MSLALYRKYRSATFADLIGQAHIATTLRNQVRGGEVTHAYLFSGIRGTGKTSSARILARAVNCLDPQDGEPCNRCAACQEITGGGAMDVLEIDAASNRGIDEMRDLREKVKFSPAVLRRKVYIVDEAHMLTEAAWNAFLKTLEEPPDHVLFVLATTEPNKVPETVRSRVQRFDFRRVGTAELAAHLGHVVELESATADGDALMLVAQAGQGSVRDALSVLDQALATGERPLTVATVRRALGLSDPQTLRAVLTGLAAADPAATLRGVGAAFDAGADARQLLREMARLARGAELTALGAPEGAGLTAEEAALCVELATTGRPGIWVDAIDRFSEAEINLRQPVDGRLQVELALLRLAHGSGRGGLEQRVAALEARGGSPGVATGGEPVSPAPRTPPAGPASAPAAAPAPPASPVPRLAVPPPPRPPAAGAPAAPQQPRPPAAGAPAAPQQVSTARVEPEPPAPPPVAAEAPPPLDPEVPPAIDAEVPPALDAEVPPVATASPAPASPPPVSPAPVAPAVPASLAPPPTPVGVPPDLGGWTAAWPQVIEAVDRRDRMLAGVLRSCRPVDGDSDRLVVGAPYGFHLERLLERQKAALLADAVAGVVGRRLVVEVVFSGDTQAIRSAATSPPAAAADEPEATSAVLTAFPGAHLTGRMLRDARDDTQ